MVYETLHIIIALFNMYYYLFHLYHYPIIAHLSHLYPWQRRGGQLDITSSSHHHCLFLSFIIIFLTFIFEKEGVVNWTSHHHLIIIAIIYNYLSHLYLWQRRDGQLDTQPSSPLDYSQPRCEETFATYNNYIELSLQCWKWCKKDDNNHKDKIAYDLRRVFASAGLSSSLAPPSSRGTTSIWNMIYIDVDVGFLFYLGTMWRYIHMLPTLTTERPFGAYL